MEFQELKDAIPQADILDHKRGLRARDHGWGILGALRVPAVSPRVAKNENSPQRRRGPQRKSGDTKSAAGYFLASSSRRKFTRSRWSAKTCVSGGGAPPSFALRDSAGKRWTRATKPRTARPELDGTISDASISTWWMGPGPASASAEAVSSGSQLSSRDPSFEESLESREARCSNAASAASA